MKITPLEVRGNQLKKSLRGYDIREVDELREQAADALEESAKEIITLTERLRDAHERLNEHIANERVLKDTLTNAQRMVEDFKVNARKESELLIAESRLQAEEIVRQAQGRAQELRDEIFRLKQQRLEIESSIKAVINYHSSKLVMEEDESRRADSDSEKLKFFPK
ncbi:MAG: DivIVA domain-containing protein [Deltaproteobacteria bacterium]|nr:DivIVA domain-containing protein [Deltaproteobacteria bacterium]